MASGGKRTGAGRKSRNLETGKVSAYIEDRDVLNKLAKLLKIPTVELLHQILEHKDLPAIIMKIESSDALKNWHKKPVKKSPGKKNNI